MADSEPVTEAALAGETGIARNVIVDLRRKILTPDDDFANVPGKGITFTPGGLEKIRRALAPLLTPAGPDPDPPLEKKGGAPPGQPEVVTLVVARASMNRGVSCLCHVEHSGPPARRAWVMPTARLKATTLRPGMRLAGCFRTYPDNPEVFTYDGPVPARPGLPMPEKKEAAV